MSKVYDQSYFDRWYRDSEYAPSLSGERRRKAAMAVAQAEYYLGRPVRSVLDIGCGEGLWRAPLRRLRPGLHYQGVDPSLYAAARYGRQRRIGPARFGDLKYLRFERRFDLILCVDVLHYLHPAEIRAGLAGIVEMLEGVAFLEVYTRKDDVRGDREGFRARPPSWYLKTFQAAGLLPCGSHGYLSPCLARQAAALECLRLLSR